VIGSARSACYAAARSPSSSTLPRLDLSRDHADRRDQRHRHQFEQAARGGDLRGFDVHTVGFHRAEHLFDGPAHLVPGNDLLRLFRAPATTCWPPGGGCRSGRVGADPCEVVFPGWCGRANPGLACGGRRLSRARLQTLTQRASNPLLRTSGNRFAVIGPPYVMLLGMNGITPDGPPGETDFAGLPMPLQRLGRVTKHLSRT